MKLEKKYVKYGIVAGTAVVGVVAISALMNQPVKAPENMKIMDMSLQENAFYLDETNYVKEMEEIVLPYIERYKTEGYITAADDAQIYYEQYLLDEAKNHVVILHGFTETSQKYKEAIYYFMQSGYSVTIMDHRGHGLSEREVEDPSMVHIEDFATYVSDVKTLMDEVVVPSATDSELFLYAHSMGGGIGSLFLEQYPEYFKAAVLNAPMMEIHTGSVPKIVAKGIANFMELIGKDENYILGHGPYEGMGENSFETYSEARFSYNEAQKAAHEEIQLNGGSFAWLDAGFEATKQLQEEAEKATTPILLFQADEDIYVLPEGHYAFAKEAPDTQIVFVEDSQHEIYLSTNEILIPYFNTIFDFFEEHA